MYSPFNINSIKDETLVEQIEHLLSECNEGAETPMELSDNVVRMTDVLYIYGELLTRAQKEYSLAKYQNNSNEVQLAYKLKAESTEKMPITYFNSLAQIQMFDERKKEIDLQLNVNRLKYAYDATQEKINAIKKKIDSSKYDY